MILQQLQVCTLSLTLLFLWLIYAFLNVCFITNCLIEIKSPLTANIKLLCVSIGTKKSPTKNKWESPSSVPGQLRLPIWLRRHKQLALSAEQAGRMERGNIGERHHPSVRHADLVWRDAGNTGCRQQFTLEDDEIRARRCDDIHLRCVQRKCV